MAFLLGISFFIGLTLSKQAVIKRPDTGRLRRNFLDNRHRTREQRNQSFLTPPEGSLGEDRLTPDAYTEESMADEKGKLEEAVSETKGVAEQFVSTLGLTDLILGGLTLYLVRLLYGSGVRELFPSVGYVWLDIAILACGAAFTGKVLLLLSSLVAGFVEDVIERSNLQDASSTLQSTLDRYRKLTGRSHVNKNWEKVDLATAYVINANPKLQKDLERLRTVPVMLYSATILAIPFAYYLISSGARWPIIVAIVVGILAFLIQGLVSQIDYLVTLRNNLEAMLPIAKELSSPKPKLLEEKVMRIQISTDEKLKVRYGAQLLTALAILRDALSINSDEDAERILLRLRHTNDANQRADQEIIRIGRTFIENRGEEFIDSRLEGIIIQTLLNEVPQQNELELVLLSEGSTIGIIKEGIKRIRQRLRRALSVAPSLLPEREHQEFRDAMATLLENSDMSNRAREVAAGEIMVAAQLLRRSLKDMNARGLEVIEDSDDDEE